MMIVLNLTILYYYRKALTKIKLKHPKANKEILQQSLKTTNMQTIINHHAPETKAKQENVVELAHQAINYSITKIPHHSKYLPQFM
jgi:hypothetical protein